MNKVTLVGRLTRDVESRTTESGKAMARFSVAANRRFKNAEGNYDADFINCICYDKTAEKSHTDALPYSYIIFRAKILPAVGRHCGSKRCRNLHHNHIYFGCSRICSYYIWSKYINCRLHHVQSNGYN